MRNKRRSRAGVAEGGEREDEGDVEDYVPEDYMHLFNENKEYKYKPTL